MNNEFINGANMVAAFLTLASRSRCRLFRFNRSSVQLTSQNNRQKRPTFVDWTIARLPPK
jgi:hypothetical protein